MNSRMRDRRNEVVSACLGVHDRLAADRGQPLRNPVREGLPTIRSVAQVNVAAPRRAKHKSEILKEQGVEKWGFAPAWAMTKEM